MQIVAVSSVGIGLVLTGGAAGAAGHQPLRQAVTSGMCQLAAALCGRFTHGACPTSAAGYRSTREQCRTTVMGGTLSVVAVVVVVDAVVDAVVNVVLSRYLSWRTSACSVPRSIVRAPRRAAPTEKHARSSVVAIAAHRYAARASDPSVRRRVWLFSCKYVIYARDGRRSKKRQQYPC